ncbi:olfactory receptor 10A7-like [Gastrophryne carolinensis]
MTYSHTDGNHHVWPAFGISHSPSLVSKRKPALHGGATRDNSLPLLLLIKCKFSPSSEICFTAVYICLRSDVLYDNEWEPSDHHIGDLQQDPPQPHVMNENNVTKVFIHLLGLQPPRNVAVYVFLLFLIMYCMTICGNLLIITAVYYSKTLHSPMYFFLSHLSVLDIFLATTILPNMLHSLLVKELIMPLSHCFTQFYFFGVSEISECLLLTVMSYDRYLAICRPLHYVLVMSRQLSWVMVTTSWSLSIFVLSIFTLIISKLEFSGPAVIDHFFCDFLPILESSSTDTTLFQAIQKFVSIIFAITPFSVIIVSYIYIILTILKMSSISGRQKVFSTCSSHMTVVCIYYGTLICIYLVPKRGQLHKVSKFLSLLYTVVTPLMNPIIYSLRNEELKNAVRTFTGVSTLTLT